MSVPFPLPPAIAFLRDHPSLNPAHGGKVSTDLLRPFPSLRVALLPGGDSKPWEWNARLQVEAWGEDELLVGDLATRVRNAWPSFRGAVQDGWVSGAWIDTEPYAAHDEKTDLKRYIVTVGFLLHPPKATP